MQVGDTARVLMDNYTPNIGREGEVVALHPAESPHFPYEVRFNPAFQRGRCYRAHEIEVVK
jgi:hypothetical protein